MQESLPILCFLSSCINLVTPCHLLSRHSHTSACGNATCHLATCFSTSPWVSNYWSSARFDSRGSSGFDCAIFPRFDRPLTMPWHPLILHYVRTLNSADHRLMRLPKQESASTVSSFFLKHHSRPLVESLDSFT